MEKIEKKVFKLKQKCPTIPKNGTNPHFRSKYAEYSDIYRILKPLFEECGILCSTSCKDGQVTTSLINIDDPSDYMVSTIQIPDALMDNPQKLGGCITYYRRYNLVCLLDLNTEADDDGNVASGVKSQPKRDTGGYF